MIGIIGFLFDGTINFGNIELMFIALIFGISASVVFHYFLEKKWKNKIKKSVSEIDEIGNKRIEN